MRTIETASDEAPATVRERLESESKEFRAVPSQASGELETRRVLVNASSAVALGVADGRFAVRAKNGDAGPRLEVARLELALRDVTFTADQLPPSGLTLTRVGLVLEQPTALALRWYGDGMFGWASGELPLEFRAWVRLSDGDASPLEFVRLAVPVELTVSADANEVLALTLDLSRTGVWWSWAGLFELGDLQLAVGALETSPFDVLPPSCQASR